MIKNLKLDQYCEQYGDSIYVRSNFSGKWKSERFSDLPKQEQENLKQIWNANCIIPSRIVNPA